MRNKKLIIIFSVVFALTLLVVLNSVIFSVKTVEVYCYNVQEPRTESAVIASAEIKRTTNIFMVNERKVIDRVESGVAKIEGSPRVKVINVERFFPNRVRINYIEIEGCLAIVQDGDTFICTNDGKIQSRISGVDTDDYIRLTLSTPLSIESGNGAIAYLNDTDASTVETLFVGLAKQGYATNTAVLNLIKAIDISNERFVILETTEGISWKIFGKGNMEEKLRYAYNLHVSDKLSDDDRKVGKIIVTEGKDGIIVQYSPKG